MAAGSKGAIAGASTAMVTKSSRSKTPMTPSGWWRSVRAKAIDGPMIAYYRRREG